MVRRLASRIARDILIRVRMRSSRSPYLEEVALVEV